MVEPSQKPQTLKPILQRMREGKEKFYSFVDTEYEETIMYIGKQPRKAFWIGVTIAGLTCYGGYYMGRSASSDQILSNMYSTVKQVHQQNLTMTTKVEDLTTKYDTLANFIKENSQKVDARLATQENKVQVKQAVEDGQKHVEKVKKERSILHKIGKILPWNW